MDEVFGTRGCVKAHRDQKWCDLWARSFDTSHFDLLVALLHSDPRAMPLPFLANYLGTQVII